MVSLAVMWRLPVLCARDPDDALRILRGRSVEARIRSLESLLAGDPALSAADRRAVEREEAWILGVTGPSKRYLKRRRRKRRAKRRG